MSSPSLAGRLAVCSWSLQPTDPADLADKLRATGILRAQLALDPLDKAPQTAEFLHAHGISLISGMVGCIGEDYSTLDSIRLTGGVAPDHSWERNLRNFETAADLAKDLGLRLVTFHAGFVPPDEAQPGFAKMARRVGAVADIFAARNIFLGLETGQEGASELAHFLRALDRSSVCVNFDPANMILYDKGDPVAAVGTLAPWIRQVHIKDATRTKIPGVWGDEVPVGSGEVDWPAFLAALKAIRFGGDLVIEREAGGSRVADIRTARAALENLFT